MSKVHTQPQEIQKRIEGDLKPGRFLRFLEAFANEVGWAEDTIFDLALEYNDLRREDYEVRQTDWNRFLTDEKWTELHQCVLMNQWIKGMNFKVTCVRRAHQTVVTIKCESLPPDLLLALTRILNQELMDSEQPEPASCSQGAEERERLFGAMLLSDRVAEKVRMPFLEGDFSEALRLGYEVHARRLEELLGMPLKPWKDMETIFFQDPPCFLFPDLSGVRLKVELAALARLSSGLELLLQPLLRGLEKASDDPAVILKLLVLISLLVDRLDAAVPNPSAIHKKRSPHKKASAQKKKHIPPKKKKKGTSVKSTTRKMNKTPRSRTSS